MESHEKPSISSTSMNSINGFPPSAAAAVKGKRTKRKRAVLPPPNTNTSSTSSSIANTTTEEEEDIANCLILLASLQPPPSREKFTFRRSAEAATTPPGRAGFYAYECKTCKCNKCFPTFQALGGHCASHQKQKPVAVSPTTDRMKHVEERDLVISMSSFLKPIPAIQARNSKVHECSVCGAEFSSGQALGGHMRRHRPVVPPAVAEDGKKEKLFLSFDLNRPAPTEDEKPVFLSALVDCYY